MRWSPPFDTILSDNHRKVFFQHPKGLKGEELEEQFALVSGLVNWLEAKRSDTEIVTLGVSGAQGSGKSTLAQQLAMMLEINKLSVEILSLDDFYLTRSEREKLAMDVHPLFKTRGVPGTHDLHSLVEAIKTIQEGGSVQIPMFDKARDDRQPETREVKPPIDILIVEGWCLGAIPQTTEELNPAINTLEEQEDSHGLWRDFVNQQLSGSDWRELHMLLDYLLYIKVPSFEMVLEWRGRQEQQLRESSNDGAGMNPDQLQRFIMHYERITRQMLDLLPSEADLVFVQDEEHGVKEIVLK